MKEVWNGSWEGLSEDELKARSEKYNELDEQLAEATKRLVHERDVFAAATATYGQKADERGDDTRELGKIVKRIEKGSSKDDPGSSLTARTRSTSLQARCWTRNCTIC
jgi:hypothetical protein